MVTGSLLKYNDLPFKKKTKIPSKWHKCGQDLQKPFPFYTAHAHREREAGGRERNFKPGLEKVRAKRDVRNLRMILAIKRYRSWVCDKNFTSVWVPKWNKTFILKHLMQKIFLV